VVQLQQQHRQQLQIEEFGRRLRAALQSAGKHKETFERWHSASIDEQVVVRWVDEDVQKAWGIKAAVRVLRCLLTRGDQAIA